MAAEAKSPLGVLGKTVNIGKYKIPIGVIVLVVAGGLALLTLNSKKSSAKSADANALLGQYDPAQADLEPSAGANASPTSPSLSSSPPIPIVNITASPILQQTTNPPGTPTTGATQVVTGGVSYGDYVARGDGYSYATPTGGDAAGGYPTLAIPTYEVNPPITYAKPGESDADFLARAARDLQLNTISHGSGTLSGTDWLDIKGLSASDLAGYGVATSDVSYLRGFNFFNPKTGEVR
jgi:hypothetical protein